MRAHHSAVLAALTVVCLASTGRAQGAISLQGLGYPPGQFSARSEGTAGGIADFDALSLTTPASLAGVATSALYFQYSPEFRKVTTPSGSASTLTARFPVIAGVLPLGTNWTLGLSSSTFLDRSFETSLERTQPVGTDNVTMTERTKVLGGIDDIRLGLAFSNSPVFRMGLGAHVFSGGSRITFSRLFPDSAIFISSSQQERISYVGFAGSVGVEFHPSRAIGFALSGRKGGSLRAEAGDTTLGTGNVPDHYSGSVIFEGIPGAAISVRVAHDAWSSLGSLSATGVKAFDAWDTSVGAEATGPRLVSRVIVVRAGARFRTLPFGYNGEKVSENAFAFGLGVPLTRDRATLDLSLQRASRSVADIQERGFILSFGLRVSP